MATAIFYVDRPVSMGFHKEEQTSDAVYNVFLKRINYPLADDDSHDLADDAAAQTSCIKKIYQIKHGTLERLIKSFTIEEMEDIDSSHINTFLMTYRTFSSPSQFLDKLIAVYDDIHIDAAYKENSRSLFRCATKTVLITWVDKYLSDFDDPPDYPVLHRVLEFVRSRPHPTDREANEAFDYIQHLITHKIENFQKQKRHDTGLQAGYVFNFVDAVDDLFDGPYHKNLEFGGLDENLVAEQLTYTDAELFRKLVPHECLNMTKRGKPGSRCPTVERTVQHFNDIVCRVTTTILKPKGLRAQARGRIIAKWIRIAQKVRQLKNFSSANAIVTALQSECIHRLKSCWKSLDRETLARFHDLADFFSLEANHKRPREILEQEGTAKIATMEGSIRVHKKKLSQVLSSVIHGTVPYLGIFLKDLTMVNEMPDYIESNGFVNFEKKRKEFDVLVRIQMLQQSAKQYRFSRDEVFQRWFESISVYNETEAHKRSLELEPNLNRNSSQYKKRDRKSPNGSTSSANEQLTHAVPSSSSLSSVPNFHRDDSMASTVSRDSSCSELSNSFSGHCIENKKSSLASLAVPARLKKNPSSRSLDVNLDGVIVRVRLEMPPSLQSSESKRVNYKTILINNRDRSHSVISRVFEKFEVELNGINPDDFSIVQQICTPALTKEIEIPDNTNVFYALNSSLPEITCIVRYKRLQQNTGAQNGDRRWRPFWKRKKNMSTSGIKW